MTLGEQFDIHEFLRTLESGGDFVQRCQKWRLVLTVAATTMERYEEAGILLRDLLRAHVDEWLDSAFRPDGSEEPMERQLSISTADNLMKHFQSDNPPVIRVGPDGALTLHFSYPNARAVRQGTVDVPEIHARNEAAWRFVQLIDSAWKYRVARCRGCGKYFANPSRRLSKLYKRGIRCRNCARTIAVLISRGASDKQFREHWICIAAKAWRRWTPKDGNRSGFVAREVNKQLKRGERHIKAWSVTHYKVEIERLAGANAPTG